MQKHPTGKLEIDIDGYRNRRDIIDRVARQIEKDLDLEDAMELSENPNNAYNELIASLLPVVSALRSTHHQRFLNALYRIDIDEAKLSREILANDHDKEEETICRLIIERELIKVVYRILYSNQITK